jgi:hypothetical protein
MAAVAQPVNAAALAGYKRTRDMFYQSDKLHWAPGSEV